MPKRDRAETEQKLIAATGEVLASEGFRRIGVNAVAKKAGVDKVLIYRYFGNLDGLVEAYAAQGDFWPTMKELLGPDREGFLKLPLADKVTLIFDRMIDGIRNRPLTLEILAWEMIERNQLTAHLELIREDLGRELTVLIKDEELKDPAYFQVMTAMISGAINYLASRSRNIRIYNGLELKEDHAWERIKRGIHKIAQETL